MLSVNGLSYSKGERKILDDVSFMLQPGELCALIGKSGSGKSLLLSALSGAVKGYTGEILVDDLSVGRKQLERRFFNMPGSVAVGDSENVRNCVVSARAPYVKLFSPLSSLDWQAADENIKILNLEKFADTLIEDLPDSVYKKVLIAHSFAREASVLFLDNPGEGLQPSDLFCFERAVKRYTSKGYSVLFSTHDLNLVSRIADSVIVLSGGKIAAKGSPGLLTEENIKKIYNVDAVVTKSIYTGKPEIMFVPNN